MSIVIRYLVVPFLILIAKVTFSQNIDTVYQRILADFCDKELNQYLFENECSNLKFDSKYIVTINTDATFWELDPFIIVDYFDSSFIKSLPTETDSVSWNWLISRTSFKNVKFNVDLHTKLQKTHISIAPSDTLPEGYLLRLSSPKLWDNFTYIELWIKYTYYNSGTRVLYKIDNKGKIVAKKKYNLCDDFG